MLLRTIEWFAIRIKKRWLSRVWWKAYCQKHGENPGETAYRAHLRVLAERR